MSENEKTDYFSTNDNLENKINENKTKLSESIREYRLQQNAFMNAEIEQGANQVNLAGMYKEGTKEAATASLNETYQKGELKGKILTKGVEIAEKIGIPASKIYIQNEIKNTEKKAQNTQNMMSIVEKNIERLEDRLYKSESAAKECVKTIEKGNNVYNSLKDTIKEYWSEINTLKSQQIEEGVPNNTQIAYLTRQIELAKRDGQQILKEINTYKTKFNKMDSEVISITPKLSTQRGVYRKLENSLSVLYEDINDAKITFEGIEEGGTLEDIYKIIDKNEMAGNSLRRISEMLGPKLNGIQRTIDCKNSKIRSRNDNTSWKEEYQHNTNKNEMEAKLSLDERMIKYATMN